MVHRVRRLPPSLTRERDTHTGSDTTYNDGQEGANADSRREDAEFAYSVADLDHQHNRRGSHGHYTATRSYSDSQRLEPVGAGPDTGGGSNLYSPQPGIQFHHGDAIPYLYSSHPPLLNRLPYSPSRLKETEPIINFERKRKLLCRGAPLLTHLPPAMT